MRMHRNGKIAKVFKNLKGVLVASHRASGFFHHAHGTNLNMLPYSIDKEAHAFFGHQCHWNSIGEEGFYLGYYWRFRRLNTALNANEAVFGERIRIEQEDGTLLEGKATSFNADSSNYEIVFDCGNH